MNQTYWTLLDFYNVDLNAGIEVHGGCHAKQNGNPDFNTCQKEKAFQTANNNILSFTNEFIENHMTDVMIEPLKRDLAKAGIKMELIEGLDYEIVGKKEFKQMSFSK